MKKIVIIGAGVSGLTLAQRLAKVADVWVLEKARGVGGRMSTRYAGQFMFDHGAPYWTVQTPAFQDFMQPLLGTVLARWQGEVVTLAQDQHQMQSRTATYVVATPNMNSLCKYLATGLNVKTQCEVRQIVATRTRQWRLISRNNEDLGVYDLVIATAPAPQTRRMLADYLPRHHAIHQVSFDACFAVMLGIDQPWTKSWIAAQVSSSPIQWLGVNSAKPGRNKNLTCLVLHSDPCWADAHLNLELDEVQSLLVTELRTLIKLELQQIAYLATHRWLYANRVPLLDDAPYYLDLELGLAALGDWCAKSDIETVWLNAHKIADLITAAL